MPIMDGLQATERIREVEGSSAPPDHRAHIVACTGLSAQSDKQKAVQVGCDVCYEPELDEPRLTKDRTF